MVLTKFYLCRKWYFSILKNYFENYFQSYFTVKVTCRYFYFYFIKSNTYELLLLFAIYFYFEKKLLWPTLAQTQSYCCYVQQKKVSGPIKIQNSIIKAVNMFQNNYTPRIYLFSPVYIFFAIAVWFSCPKLPLRKPLLWQGFLKFVLKELILHNLLPPDNKFENHWYRRFPNPKGKALSVDVVDLEKKFYRIST